MELSIGLRRSAQEKAQYGVSRQALCRPARSGDIPTDNLRTKLESSLSRGYLWTRLLVTFLASLVLVGHWGARNSCTSKEKAAANRSTVLNQISFLRQASICWRKFWEKSATSANSCWVRLCLSRNSRSRLLTFSMDVTQVIVGDAP